MDHYCNCKLPLNVSLKCHLFLLLSVFHHLVHDRLPAVVRASFPVYFIDRMMYSCHSLSGFPCCSPLFLKELEGLQEAPLGDYCVFVSEQGVNAWLLSLSKCYSMATSVDFHTAREPLKRIQLRWSSCQTTSE